MQRRESGFANITQNAHYMNGIITDYAPALLRSSVLYSLSSGRQLCAVEYLLIQGIRNFPYETINPRTPECRRVSRRALKAMAGNGMHSAAVGSMIMFALGSCTFVAD